jgi:hypothetical protein
MVNLCFNLAMILASLLDKGWLKIWALYWLGALIINTAVMLIRLKVR